MFKETRERLSQIETRLNEIKGEVEKKNDLTIDELDKRNKEVEDLKAEKIRLVEQDGQAVLNAFNEAPKVDLFGTENKAKTERAEMFVKTNRMAISSKEQRAALLSSGKIAKPSAVDGIYDNLDGELGILNDVIVKNYAGNETVAHAYRKSGLTASDHTEGSAPAETGSEYGIIKVAPVPKSLITYISKAIRRLTPLDYESEVRSAALSALRTSAEDFIISKIPTCVDTDGNKLASAATLKETAIGEKTLREIVLSYKPGKRYSGIATLFLTREQLIAFGDVRGTNEKKAVYEITPDNSNTRGTIKDGGLIVNYRIVDGLANMLYGYLSAFELDTFGDYQIEVSEDYKFAEGLLAVRGEAWFGGSLVVDKAFEVISFKATASTGK